MAIPPASKLNERVSVSSGTFECSLVLNLPVQPVDARPNHRLTSLNRSVIKWLIKGRLRQTTWDGISSLAPGG